MLMASRLSGPMLALTLAAGSAGAVTITVNTDEDLDVADGFCSLREAIIAANTNAAHNECPAGSGEDRIAFDLTLPAVIPIAEDMPVVTESLAIRGPSTTDLTIDGIDQFRLLVFDTPNDNGLLVLENLTLTRGRAPGGTILEDGAALYVGLGELTLIERVAFRANNSLNGGGALVVDGEAWATTRAEIRRSTFDGNRALGFRGGGAIEVVEGELYLADSTLSSNSVEWDTGGGGALEAKRSAIEVERSTFSGNASYDDAGAISVSASTGAASLRVVDSTITDNWADSDGSGFGWGGGIRTSSGTGFTVELRLVNSIIALNHDTVTPHNPDLYMAPANTTLITTGWNLVGNNLGATALFPAGNPSPQGNFVGTSASPIDPRLEALADNGGPTLTHRPLLEAASPVIDHGYCTGGAPSDQRGWGSPANNGRMFDHSIVEPNGSISDGCDIGAVERGASPKSGVDLFASDFESVTLLRWSAAQP